jgi:hypothetical protein
MTTYTIAYCDNVLWALAPDDDEESLKRQLQVYRDQLEMFELGERDDGLIIERGLILTNELEHDDDLVWTGGAHVGDLSVEPGRAFRYAVRRGKERVMELMKETIETLIEFDEPEALLATLQRAAAKQKGERWDKLALALSYAQDKMAEWEKPASSQPVDNQAAQMGDSEAKAE